MSKQTAVEWLESEFIKLESTTGVHGIMYELIEQAKEMEKEQIKSAYERAIVLYGVSPLDQRGWI
jgi:hypothetical protein